MKREVISKDTELIISATMNRPVLFTDKNGDGVASGDTVEFYVQGDIFPHQGTVSNLRGIRVDCWNNFMNRWEYYDVVTPWENPLAKGMESEEMTK